MPPGDKTLVFFMYIYHEAYFSYCVNLIWFAVFRNLHPLTCEQCSGFPQTMSSQQPPPYGAQSLCTGQLSAMQFHANQTPYTFYQYQPDHTENDVYIQQYATQPITPVFSTDENRVCVLDGQGWSRYDLEKVFSWKIPCQESPRGGTYLGMIAL